MEASEPAPGAHVVLAAVLVAVKYLTQRFLGTLCLGCSHSHIVLRLFASALKRLALALLHVMWRRLQSVHDLQTSIVGCIVLLVINSYTHYLTIESITAAA